ncbi:hypothetical protein AB0M52_31745, partial [Micromonospora sp. NPDC051296]
MTITAPEIARSVRPSERRPSLARLTAVELRKLVDTRAGRWLLITIGLVAALIVTLQLVYAPDAEQTFVNFFVPSLLPVGLLAGWVRCRCPDRWTGRRSSAWCTRPRRRPG